MASVGEDQNRKFKTKQTAAKQLRPPFSFSFGGKKPEVVGKCVNVDMADTDCRKAATFSAAGDSGVHVPISEERRPSQPLLTIAEEEEAAAVDPARRGSASGAAAAAGVSPDDEDDERSTGDTFDDVRHRRLSLQRAREGGIDEEDEDDDDDDDDDNEDDDDDDDGESPLTTIALNNVEKAAVDVKGGKVGEQKIKVDENIRKENAKNAGGGDVKVNDHEKQRHIVVKDAKVEHIKSSSDPNQKDADDKQRTRQKATIINGHGSAVSSNSGRPKSGAVDGRTSSSATRPATGRHESDRQGKKEPSTPDHKQRPHRGSPGQNKPTAQTPCVADVSKDKRAAWLSAAARGDSTTIDVMTSWRPDIINITDDFGRTALFIAAEARHASVVDRLLKAGALCDIRSVDGETALHAAARHLDRTIVARLLAAGADPNTPILEDGTTPVHLACQHGDGSRLARLLLRHGARPDVTRRSRSGAVAGIGPLHDAADSGDVGSVRALLDADPSLTVNATTERGCTALHVAVRHGKPDVVGELIARGGRGSADRAGADSRGDGVRPLHVAAEHGRLEAVRMLIEAGAEVDATRKYCSRTGVTALQLAVAKAHPEVAAALIAAGASVDRADSDGTTALHFAARNGLVDVAAALLARHTPTSIGTKAQYHQGRASALPQNTSASNQTPLHFAVRYRHLDVVRLLLQAGCDVNATEQMTVERRSALDGRVLTDRPAVELVDGYTALHWAVENGDLHAARLLLDAGANPDREASFDAHRGVSPLHLAAQDGYADIADELLRRGARRDPRKRTRNRDNVTPLHQAAYNGHAAAVAVLVRAGCDVNIQADNGYAAIHYAAQQGNVEMTRAILEAGGGQQHPADLGLLAVVKDQSAITPLHLAVQSGNIDVIRALAAAGAQINAGKKMAGGISGVTPLHQAVYQLRDDVVDVLLELKADPGCSMNGWYRPLHVAAETGSASIATRLLRAGARVDTRASFGDHADLTPLHVAAQHGRSTVARVLVDAGADLNAVRKFGERSRITSLHLAAEYGFVDSVLVLLELMAAKSPSVAAHTANACDRSSASLPGSSHPWSSPLMTSFVNAQDSMGFTALHLGVQYQFFDVVQVLLSVGADPSIRTLTGLTAVKMANHLPNAAIRDMLRVEHSSSGRHSRSVSSVPIPRKSDRHRRHQKHPGKLRSLLCGVDRR